MPESDLTPTPTPEGTTLLHAKLTYANVFSTLCLLMLVTGGGVANAQAKVGSGDLKNEAVKSKHLKNGTVKSKDLTDLLQPDDLRHLSRSLAMPTHQEETTR